MHSTLLAELQPMIDAGCSAEQGHKRRVLTYMRIRVYARLCRRYGPQAVKRHQPRIKAACDAFAAKLGIDPNWKTPCGELTEES